MLYTSGYTENAIIHHGRLDPGVHLLSKPYGIEELGRKLRLVIANHAMRSVATLDQSDEDGCAPMAETQRF